MNLPKYDVAIFGAGVVGCSIAWHLARTNCRALVIEKNNDIASGATRANSGILHSGIHEKPGSQMFHRCRKGLDWYRTWSKKLDFPLLDKATLIVSTNQEQTKDLIRMLNLHSDSLLARIVKKDELHKKHPYLCNTINTALEVEDSAQICPYESSRAMMENAIDNGLTLKKNLNLLSASFTGNYWKLVFEDKKVILANTIVLAAGKGMKELSKIFALPAPPTKYLNGIYYLLERNRNSPIHPIIFGPREAHTKGLIVQETVHGNILIGPDSIESYKIEDHKKAEFEWNRLCEVWQRAKNIVPELNRKSILRTFSGNRSVCGDDFQINDYLTDKNIIALHGIKSPGLTVSPVLAEEVLEMLQKKSCYREAEQSSLHMEFHPADLFTQKSNKYTI